jgi:hypothetical protein
MRPVFQTCDMTPVAMAIPSLSQHAQRGRRHLLAAMPVAMAWLATPVAAQPCCGPVTADGERLLARLDASGVERLWLPHGHVDWETGEPDMLRQGRTSSNHCSAFVAAFAKQLGVYILRPPAHSPMLLASAQMRWLTTDGAAAGWRRLADSAAAQQSANQGNLVVAVWENPDRHKPGHIAFVRPGLPDAARLAADGPDVTQAGATNALAMPLKRAFRHHPGAWPDRISFFAHPVS